MTAGSRKSVGASISPMARTAPLPTVPLPDVRATQPQQVAPATFTEALAEVAIETATTDPVSAKREQLSSEQADALVPHSAVNQAVPTAEAVTIQQNADLPAASTSTAVPAGKDEDEMSDLSEVIEAEDTDPPAELQAFISTHADAAVAPVKDEPSVPISAAASELSDLSDLDEDEVVAPIRAATPSAPQSKASKPRRSSQSATPQSFLGPARTRRMLAAEAALLTDTPRTALDSAAQAAPQVPPAVDGPSSPLSTVSAAQDTPQAEAPAALVEAPASPAPVKRSARKQPPSSRKKVKSETPRGRSTTPTAAPAGTGPSTTVRTREVVQKRMAELIPRYQYVDLEDEEREIPDALLTKIPKACIGEAKKGELLNVQPNERMLLVNYFGFRREWYA